MATEESDRAEIERVLARPIADATRAVWGFQNRTDMVTLATGDRVVVQRYRRRQDAEYRLRAMVALWTPAAEAGIAIPRVREFDLDASPAWVIFDALPGVPVPEAGDAALEGARFPAIARSMGELLAAFRALPTEGLKVDDLWADRERLAACAAGWGDPKCLFPRVHRLRIRRRPPRQADSRLLRSRSAPTVVAWRRRQACSSPL